MQGMWAGVGKTVDCTPMGLKRRLTEKERPSYHWPRSGPWDHIIISCGPLKNVDFCASGLIVVGGCERGSEVSSTPDERFGDASLGVSPAGWATLCLPATNIDWTKRHFCGISCGKLNSSEAEKTRGSEASDGSPNNLELRKVDCVFCVVEHVPFHLARSLWYYWALTITDEGSGRGFNSSSKWWWPALDMICQRKLTMKSGETAEILKWVESLVTWDSLWERFSQERVEIQMKRVMWNFSDMSWQSPREQGAFQNMEVEESKVQFYNIKKVLEDIIAHGRTWKLLKLSRCWVCTKKG